MQQVGAGRHQRTRQRGCTQVRAEGVQVGAAPLWVKSQLRYRNSRAAASPAGRARIAVTNLLHPTPNIPSPPTSCPPGGANVPAFNELLHLSPPHNNYPPVSPPPQCPPPPTSLFPPGGANVPALNELLQPYGIAFGDAIIHGTTTIAGVSVQVGIPGGGGGEGEDLKSRCV